MKFRILLFLIVLLNLNGFAQPATEVYLLDIKKNKTSFSIDPNTKPENISNNIGYDNQPPLLARASSSCSQTNEILIKPYGHELLARAHKQKQQYLKIKRKFKPH
jgi:hypothetical protein